MRAAAILTFDKCPCLWGRLRLTTARQLSAYMLSRALATNTTSSYYYNGVVDVSITGAWSAATERVNSPHWSSFDSNCSVCLAGCSWVFRSVFWQWFRHGKARYECGVSFVDKDGESGTVWEESDSSVTGWRCVGSGHCSVSVLTAACSLCLTLFAWEISETLL